MVIAPRYLVTLQRPVLFRLSELLPPGEPCYLVGGAVRDALLGRLGQDFDFATPGDPTALARQLATSLAGHWFFLDEQRRQSRVLLPEGEGELTCDFAPFRGRSLDEDLALRDFTINAMALPLGVDGHLGDLYDPLRGREDLRKGLLRICSPQVLQDDPLRLLKGIRHCQSHRLAIDPHTLQAMRMAGGALGRVAAERVRDELTGILAITPVARGLRLLAELGVVEFLFGKPGGRDAFQQGAKLVRQVESWLSALASAPEAPLAEKAVRAEIEPGITRTVALKLSAFFKGYGVSEPWELLRGWRTSRRLQNIVASLVSLSAGQFEAFRSLSCGARGRALWLEKLGPDPVAGILFLAMQGGREGLRQIALVEQALNDLQECSREGRIPDLVDGAWLQKILGFWKGPEVGSALAALRREEIAGRVRTRRDAEVFLAAFGQKSRQKND